MPAKWEWGGGRFAPWLAAPAASRKRGGTAAQAGWPLERHATGQMPTLRMAAKIAQLLFPSLPSFHLVALVPKFHLGMPASPKLGFARTHRSAAK